MAGRRLGGPALAAALALLLAAGQAAACARPQGWIGGARIAGELWTAWWRSEPASLPVSEHFLHPFSSLRTAGRPGPGARLDAGPPARNELPARGDPERLCPERPEGLLFHMPGRWQLILEVRGVAGREKLIAETVLE